MEVKVILHCPVCYINVHSSILAIYSGTLATMFNRVVTGPYFLSFRLIVGHSSIRQILDGLLLLLFSRYENLSDLKKIKCILECKFTHISIRLIWWEFKDTNATVSGIDISGTYQKNSALAVLWPQQKTLIMD